MFKSTSKKAAIVVATVINVVKYNIVKTTIGVVVATAIFMVVGAPTTTPVPNRGESVVSTVKIMTDGDRKVSVRPAITRTGQRTLLESRGNLYKLSEDRKRWEFVRPL